MGESIGSSTASLESRGVQEDWGLLWRLHGFMSVDEHTVVMSHLQWARILVKSGGASFAWLTSGGSGFFKLLYSAVVGISTQIFSCGSKD